MSTAIITTSAYSGTNKLRIDLSKATAPTTVVDTQGPLQGPLASNMWTFQNLIPGDTYIYKLLEVDNSTGSIINTLITDIISINNTGTLTFRSAVNLIPGTTPNVTPGATTALLDGSNGSPDLRTWDILPFLQGVGPIASGLDYAFDKTSGLFTLMNGVQFVRDAGYFVTFEPKTSTASPAPIVRDAWSSDLTVTADTTLTSADFGKNVVIQGTGGYLKITLPDIVTVLPGKLLYFEIPADSLTKCAEIACSLITGNDSLMSWPKPNKSSLFICRGESLAIYKQGGVWRVKFAEGNFKRVGEFVSEYANAANVINKVPIGDGIYSNKDYARLYDYVLALPSDEVVDFTAWAGNKYKFSFADSNGDFHVPDLRDLYERSSGTSLSGVYQANEVGPHSHPLKYVMNGTDGTPNGQQIDPGNFPVENNLKGENTYAIDNNTGTETRPETIVVNRYIRC